MTASTILDVDHTRSHGCHLDIGKTGSTNWCLEIDFIHAHKRPDFGGWAVIRHICIMCGAKSASPICKESAFTSYASAWFTSAHRARRASRMVAAAIDHLHFKEVGLQGRLAPLLNRPFEQVLRHAINSQY